MVKAPVAGRVKTRIAAELGVAAAVRFARHSLASLLRRVGADGRWSTTLAVTPDIAAASRLWPRGVPRVSQGGGDLGARMQRLFERTPPGPLVLIGTDIPGITRAHIAAAFRLLGRHDAVFGPATDGGYWLVGVRRRPRVLRPFRGVRWSTQHALADTLGQPAQPFRRPPAHACQRRHARRPRPLRRRVRSPGALTGLRSDPSPPPCVRASSSEAGG